MAFAFYTEGTAPVYYFYELNLQGDIIGIYDENGAKVVGFRYDAWGNFNTDKSNTTVCTDLFLRASLFRYRSYIYDYETDLYYLQSRYYDYEIGRFINADGYINANGDLIGYNMYAYCSNNPVNYIDPSGNVIEWVVLAVLGVVAIIVLPSCSDADTADTDTSNADEFEVSVGGTTNMEEKINEAISRTHSKALENNHSVEWGTFVYRYVYDDGEVGKYYHMIPVYTTIGTEHIDVRYDLLPSKCQIVAFIHTHNKHNVTLIFNPLELPDSFDNYVVDVGGCVYYAPAGATYTEVKVMKRGTCWIGE